MEIDLPDVLAEVRAVFERYEKALVSNDVAMLDELFHDDARTIRYGVNEILYGYNDIKSFRGARSSRPTAGISQLPRRCTNGRPHPASLGVRCKPG